MAREFKNDAALLFFYSILISLFGQKLLWCASLYWTYLTTEISNYTPRYFVLVPPLHHWINDIAQGHLRNQIFSSVTTFTDASSFSFPFLRPPTRKSEKTSSIENRIQPHHHTQHRIVNGQPKYTSNNGNNKNGKPNKLANTKLHRMQNLMSVCVYGGIGELMKFYFWYLLVSFYSKRSILSKSGFSLSLLLFRMKSFINFDCVDNI